MPHTLHVFLNAEDEQFKFTPPDFEPLIDAIPSLNIEYLSSEAELLDALPTTQWLDTWRFDEDWYKQARNLQHVFTPAAGKDWVRSDPQGKTATHFGSFHGTMMAESALAMVLQFTTQQHQYARQQRETRWQRLPARLLSSQSALIVGYGHIGRQCGQLLSQMGMEVWGTKRHPEQRQDGKVQLIAQSELGQYLPRADHILSFLPGNAATHHFFDAQRLGQLSPHARLYNFGRGTTIDEVALTDALNNERLAGAGLDVTEMEPLPSSSTLWQHPRVILLPHASAYYEEYRRLHVMELTNLMKNLH